ncbi:MAG: glycosyltransferase family 39 protein [Planctomycetaceae bacterium]|nr:glycosyltransferase family 39 protein [Planctomycetaceae bacterium]
MNPFGHPASDPREQPISRYELWAVVAITLLGAAVRFAFPSAMAIEHFDEGVYASNLLFPDQGNEYPDRHLYAPSLVPALIEWSIILFGDKGIAPMLPSLLFGTLTIPLIWWVGRQWFGPLSGIAAATLLSLSDFHIAFSRSALTDVPLCFWLLLAVYLFERAFRDLSWPTAIAAGFTTGLAWWTKYNGWLPLAISLSGLMAWSLFVRRDERHFLRRLALWVAAAVTAVLVWSPYWLSLPNGYAEVARNHSQYVVGFAGWLSSATRQRDSLCAFGSLIGCVGLISALVGAMQKSYSARKTIAPDILRAVRFVAASWVLLGVAVPALIFSANFWLLMSAFNLVFWGFASVVKTAFVRIQNQRFESANGALGGHIREWTFNRSAWLIAAWVIGLTVSVPLYRPYPRLALAWLIGSILMLVGGSPALIRSMEPRGDSPQKWTLTQQFWFPLGVVGWGFLFLLAPSDFSFRNALVFRCWESRSQFREIARKVTSDAFKVAQAGNQKPIQNTRAVLYVYAEPGLFFHLPTDNLAVQPAGNLSFVDIEATRKLPTFLVTGPHAQRSKAFADEFAKRADQFELIASYPYDASDFVRLDDVSATQLRAHREPLEVRLYRVRDPE